MKIVKEQGQLVTYMKGFDLMSCLSSLPFEEEAEDEPEALVPTFDILGFNASCPSRDHFTFIEEQYNLLHESINLPSSSIDSLSSLLLQIQAQQTAI